MPPERSTLSTQPVTEKSDLFNRLSAIVGDDQLSVDMEKRSLYSHDVFFRPDVIADIIVTPGNTEQLAQVVQAATQAGSDIHVRGGGMSYTDAYTPSSDGAVLIDMTGMNRVLEINEADMYVRVEAGCTWAVLNDALEEKGLRTPFWGPLSGLISTIGGGLSQNNAFFGSSIWGTTSESLVSIKVVIADGTILETGSASTIDAAPFYRYYGPDLTGLFTGDAGALGVKAEATFRLIKRPLETGFISFAFASSTLSASAMSELSRHSVGTEVFGFDPGLTKIAMSRGKWSAKLKTVAQLAKSQKSLLEGVKQATKTVVAGKSIVHRGEYSLHLVCEGRSTAAIEAELKLAREIAHQFDGKEIDNSIAKVIRAAPFGPVDSMVGPNGERWVPTHGIVSHTAAPQVWEDMVKLFEDHQAELDKYGVSWGFLTCTMASNGFLLEPVMIWPDELYPMHLHYVRPEHLKGTPTFPAAPEARKCVADLRKMLIALFTKHHAVHFQIGKAYPYREHRKKPLWALLESLKAAVDPNGRINPGCLGLTKKKE